MLRWTTTITFQVTKKIQILYIYQTGKKKSHQQNLLCLQHQFFKECQIHVMSLFTILSSYVNLGSNLKTEVHIPVMVIRSCIWHSVWLLVKCSKPTACTRNNLQWLTTRRCGTASNLKREAIPRHSRVSPKNLFSLPCQQWPKHPPFTKQHSTF